MAITDISQLSPDLKAAATQTPNGTPPGQDALSAGPTVPSPTAPVGALPLTPNAASPGMSALQTPDRNASFADKIRQAADKLGIPPGPGGWAKSLVGAAQTVLSGADQGLQNAGQDFTNAEPAPNSGILGGFMAEQAAKAKRLQATKVAQTQEDKERGMIAYTNAQTMLQEQTLHRLKGEVAEKANNEAVQNGQAAFNMAVTKPAAFG